MSYLYFGAVGTISVVLVGVAVSYATGNKSMIYLSFPQCFYHLIPCLDHSAQTDIQCIRKVFRPLDFFQVLLPQSTYTIPHNDKAKIVFFCLFCFCAYLHKYSDPLLSTLLKHLRQ
jgi:hypothetical protein